MSVNRSRNWELITSPLFSVRDSFHYPKDKAKWTSTRILCAVIQRSICASPTTQLSMDWELRTSVSHIAVSSISPADEECFPSTQRDGRTRWSMPPFWIRTHPVNQHATLSKGESPCIYAIHRLVGNPIAYLRQRRFGQFLMNFQSKNRSERTKKSGFTIRTS